MKIAAISIGIMGSGIAMNLLESGHIVFDGLSSKISSPLSSNKSVGWVAECFTATLYNRKTVII
jgi:3-hydroxyisobutyrate dehydrogenase-like beta-hydroxyacid dehydrogenase